MSSQRLYWKLLSQMTPEDKRINKLAQLALEADTEEADIARIMRDSKDRILREASDLGKDAKSTQRILGDTDIPDDVRASMLELAGKKSLAKALSEGDISTIIDNAKYLNQQGRAALEEMLLERGDTNKMFSLNKQLSNRYMDTDVSEQNRILNDIKRRFGLSEAQSDVDSKFVREASLDPSAVGGEIYDVPVETSGMSAIPRSAMRDDIRNAMKMDNLKKNRQFLGDIDEILADPDIPSDLIANNSRYKAWIENMENSLKKRGEAKRNLDSRLRERNRISSGYGKSFDDIGDIHERANTAPLREALDNDNVDYILDQFEEARDLERKNPTPRARDYGDETLYLKEIMSRHKKRKDNESTQARRKMITEATKKETVNPEYREYLDKESRDLVSEVKDRKHKAANKILEKYKYRNPVGWNSRDYADFAKGKAPKKTEFEAIRDSESKAKELADLEDKYNKYIGSKNLGKNRIEYSNKVSTAQGMRASKWNKPATREFIAGISRENGFRFSEQMIDRMLRMTKQQVIDFIDNISNPG